MRGLGTLALHTLPVGKALEVFPENRGRTPRRRHQIRGAVKPPRDSHRAELQNDTRREALGEKKKIPAAAGGMRLQGYVARTQGTRAVRRQPRPAPVRGEAGGRPEGRTAVTRASEDGAAPPEPVTRGRNPRERAGGRGKSQRERGMGWLREGSKGHGDTPIPPSYATAPTPQREAGPQGGAPGSGGRAGVIAAMAAAEGCAEPAGGRRPAPRRPERGPQTPKRLPLPHVVVSPADPNVAFRNGLLLK